MVGQVRLSRPVVVVVVVFCQSSLEAALRPATSRLTPIEPEEQELLHLSIHSAWNRWEREQPAPAATTCRWEGLAEQDGALGLPRIPKQSSPRLIHPVLLLLVLLLLLPLSQCETTKSNRWILTEGQRRNKLSNTEWNPSLVRIFWAADGKLRRSPCVSRVLALWI